MSEEIVVTNQPEETTDVRIEREIIEVGTPGPQGPPGDGSGGGGTVPDATNLIKGKIRLAGALGGTADTPTVPGLADKADSDDGRFPSVGEKQALAGSSGVPGPENKFVTDADSRLSDERDPKAHTHEPGDVKTTDGDPGDVLTIKSGVAKWEAPSGGGGGGSYSAGSGLKLTGTEFSADFGAEAGKVMQGNDSRVAAALQAGDVSPVTLTWADDPDRDTLYVPLANGASDGTWVNTSWSAIALDEIAGGGSGPTVGEWQDVATDSENGFENGWDNTGGLPDCRWRREGDTIRLAGIALGAAATDDQIFTLPNPDRPEGTVAFSVAVTSDGTTFTTGMATIDDQGQLVAFGGPFVMVIFSGVTVELT